MSNEINENAELDFASTEFNALDALTSDVEIPVPEAPVYDNLGQFISNVRNRGRSTTTDDEAGPSTAENRFNTSTRRFLPHQEPVMGRGRGRVQRSVLTRMDEVTQGPMSVLRNCMLNKTRVKVWIRGPKWIRGYCIGYVAAFDKQWNLALTDVDETFTRTRHRKTPIYGDVEHISSRFEAIKTEDSGTENDQQTGLSAAGSKDPEEDADSQAKEEPYTVRSTKDCLTGTVVKQIHRRHELCQRHISQLFIRGEQVALVAVLPL